MPTAVTIFPSRATRVFPTVAPVSSSSNPGKQTAVFPRKYPPCPNTIGAAQIAARYPPFRSAARSACATVADSSRCFAPGIPPGRMTISGFASRYMVSGMSGWTAIPCAPVIHSPPPTPTVVTATPARRNKSNGHSASISSKPFAKNR